MDSKTGSSNPLRPAPRLAPVFVAFVLAVLLSGGFLFEDLHEGTRQEAQRHIETVGTLKANQIRDWLDGRYAEARILADNSFFAREATLWMRGGGGDGVRRKRLVDRFEAFLNVHHFQAIVLYDVSGRVMLSAGERVSDVQQRKNDACTVATSGQLKFIDLHRYEDTYRTVRLGFMAPLLEGSSCSGAIYLVEDPEKYLYPLIKDWPGDSETAEMQLVRKEGDRVLFLNQLRQRTEPPLGFSLPLDTSQFATAAMRGQPVSSENAQDYRGKPVLSFAMAIEGTPWVLISKMDEDEVYRSIDQASWVAGVLAISMFVMTGAWFWQWRRRDVAETDAAIMKERARGEALRVEVEKRYRTVFEQTALPTARNSPMGEFVEVNEAWCEMFGYSRAEVSARHLSWQQLTHPEDMEPGNSLVKKMLAGEIADFKIEKRYIHKEGKVLWGSLQVKLVRDEKGMPEFFISTIQDITDRKLAESAISFMAYHDKLTGLPNRALLFDRLSQAMSQAKRDAKHVALMFIDLDGFKAVNDQYGHEAGDNVLKMSAQRFLACVRAADTVARLGGDEFAIILGNLDDPQQAEGVSEKIVQAFAQNMTLDDGRECTVGASVGISIYPEHGSAMDNLMTAADHAMYESKRRGKNTYTFFKEKASQASNFQWFNFDGRLLLGIAEIDEQHRNLAYLVNRLNDAVKRDESSEAIASMLDELLLATVHHFETESRYMSSYHFPGQSEHEAEHAQLVNEAQQFKEQFSQGRELLVLQSLKDWLLGHIIYSDKKMGAYLVKQGVK